MPAATSNAKLAARAASSVPLVNSFGAGQTGGHAAGACCGGGGVGVGGSVFDMPHVVPGCEIFEPGRAFKWQGPFPCLLLATHSHAKQPSSASQSAQHAAKLLALVHANALCVQEMSSLP